MAAKMLPPMEKPVFDVFLTLKKKHYKLGSGRDPRHAA